MSLNDKFENLLGILTVVKISKLFKSPQKCCESICICLAIFNFSSFKLKQQMTQACESVDVIIQELELNPKCEHGPTVLFSLKNGKKYFSCSGTRNSDCFYLDYDKFEQGRVPENARLTNETSKCGLGYTQVKNLRSSQRIYCKTCGVFIEPKSSHESHDVVKGVDDKMFEEPSLFLQQLDDDKVNAQYFFDDNTLHFVCSMFEGLKISKIVCIGCPRLHDFIKTKRPDLHSILMDIDDRFKAFNHPGEFIKYNMFNHHFFNGSEDEEKLKTFLKDEHPSRTEYCIFTDPPFAARTELLAYTFQTFAKLFNDINSHHKVLPVFWVFPYFNEHHVKKVMPGLEMLDFQISYMNHKAYHDGFKGRKAGSPIRIFTNVDASLIRYPASFKNYRFCPKCHKFVSISNLHCFICNMCPSKNGTTYRHCTDCIKCVKPNYKHCSICNRCVPRMDHRCEGFQKFQECWLCSERGHVEKNCSFMKTLKRRKDGACVVCKGKKTHNLKKCPLKWKVLDRNKV